MSAISNCVERARPATRSGPRVGAWPEGAGARFRVWAPEARAIDVIERGAQAEAPKYMEWYGAFGLMVTLIWLYLEILRLLGKFQRR